MRYLAIDYGAKRIGLAVSDAGESLAFPLAVLQADASSTAKIAKTARDEKIHTIVMGLPLNMDGTEGQSAMAVRTFSRQLKKVIDLPIVFFDERLSSFEADNKIAGMELSRKKKKQRQDAIAAAAFLQAFLDDKKRQVKDRPELVILENADQAAQRAAEIFCKHALESITHDGIFRCAVSGGSSPAAFFALLAEQTQLEWSKIHIFWADERFVPQTHPDSNYRLAFETFLSKVPLPAENIHPVDVSVDSAGKAAAEYEQVLRRCFSVSYGQFPVFDLIILGLGADGHTASLLPETDILNNQNDSVACVKSKHVRHERISLTAPVLGEAKTLLFIIAGQSKADIVRAVLAENPESYRYPVHLLWPAAKKMIWLMDRPAAAKIGD